MKWIAVLVLLAVAHTASAQSCAPDPRVEQVRRVVEKHAHKWELQRKIGGVALIAIGAGAAGIGSYAYAKTDRNELLAPIAYTFDYTMFGIAGVGLIGGTLILAMQSPVEDIREDMLETIAAGDPQGAATRARRAIDDYQQRMRLRQDIMGAAGVGLAGLTVAGLVEAHRHPDLLEHTSGQLMLVGTLFAGAMSGSMIAASLSQNEFDLMQDDLQKPTMTPLVAPTTGGGVIGLAGTF